MEQVLCRTCLDLADKKKCTEITKPCCFEKTVKDVIIMLVPEMVSTLLENEYVCRNCLRTLRSSFKFIERCLEVELLNAESKEALEAKIDIDDFFENNTRVSQQFVDKKVLLLDNDYQEFNLDHNYYIKIEPKDEDNLENKAENVNNATENYSTPLELSFDDAEFENEELNIKDEVCKSPEYLFYDSLSLYDEDTDANNENVNLDSGDLPQEALTYSKDLDSENSQSTSLLPPESDKFSCVTCSEKFTCRSDFDLHLDIHPPLICHYCGKGFKTNSTYTRHIRFHTEKCVGLCEFCGKGFKTTGALNLHITGVHRDESAFMCDRCPKRFTNKFRLGLHTRVVHDRVKQQQCPDCGKLFQNGMTCKTHYRLVHLKLKPFVCDVCGQEFGRSDYLRKHMFCHRGEPYPSTHKTVKIPKFGIRLKDPGTPVDCKICGKTIASVSLLKGHLQTHVKIKRYECKYCDLTFTVSNNRNRHQRQHEIDPGYKFRCNICWKKMKTEEDLEKHTTGHYIDRPPQYACDICGEKFHRKYLLNNHQLNKHTVPEDIKKAEEEIILKNILEYAHPRFLCHI